MQCLLVTPHTGTANISVTFKKKQQPTLISLYCWRLFNPSGFFGLHWVGKYSKNLNLCEDLLLLSNERGLSLCQ